MITSFTLIAALTAGICSAQAGDKSIGDGSLPEFLKQFDTNDDGRIDREERQAIRDLRRQMRQERRSSIDTDGDGKISAEELEAAREEIRVRIEARRREKFSQIAGEDDLISPEEYATIPGINRLPDFIFEAIFSRLDVDESGNISESEFFNRLRRHEPVKNSIELSAGNSGADADASTNEEGRETSANAGGSGQPRPPRPPRPPHRSGR